MPSKRYPHRQRRQSRNRAERQAREARRAAAAHQARAGADPDGAGSAPRRRWRRGTRAAASTPQSPAGATSAGQRSRSSAASRSAPRARGTAFATKPPGSRAAFLALLFAIGALVSVLFLQIPVDDGGAPLSQAEIEELDERRAAGEDIPERERNAFAALWPLSLLYVLPIGVGAIAVWGSNAVRPARVWMRTLIAMTVFAIISGIPFLYFPMVLALAVATFQSRRAEVQATQATQATGAGSSSAARNGVIDVTEAGSSDTPSSEAGSTPPRTGENDQPRDQR